MDALLRGWWRVLAAIGRVEQVTGVALLALIVVTISIQVFTRYLFGRPLVWVEELATYAFIWSVFIGAALGMKELRHIRIDTFVVRLAPRPQAFARAALWALATFAAVVVAIEALEIMPIEARSRTMALPVELDRHWFYSVPLFAEPRVDRVHRLLSGRRGARARRSTGRPVEAEAEAARRREAEELRSGAMTFVLLMFVVMFGLIALELPVAFALILASLFYLAFGSQAPLSVVVQRMAPGIDSFPLLAIPLFVLAGNLLNVGGISQRIFDFALAVVGHFRGGLAQVNIFASLIFAGMSGVAQADAAGLGTVEIKAMKKEGFDPAFAAACSAASAIVGPIIPPSVIMVIYGVLAQVSIGDLFLAGIIPGFVIGLLLMGMVYYLVTLGGVYAPVQPRTRLPALGRAFVRAVPPLAAPVLLVAGLLAGVATPTELGALTVVYAAGLGLRVSRADHAQALPGARGHAGDDRRAGVHPVGGGAVRLGDRDQQRAGAALRRDPGADRRTSTSYF